MTLTRREAIVRLAALSGTAVIGAEFLLTGCARTDKRVTRAFTDADVALLDEVAETILPATDTPGAKAAHVGAFMAMAVTDCYTDEQHLIFQDGLAAVDAASQSRFRVPFLAASAGQRTELLNALHADEQAQAKASAGKVAPPHYFRLMRELAVIGYFSSEIGATQALRYAESPGAYRGDVPYRTGDRAWFNPSRRLS